jgi:hypothetical protein
MDVTRICGPRENISSTFPKKKMARRNTINCEQNNLPILSKKNYVLLTSHWRATLPAHAVLDFTHFTVLSER